MRGATGGTHFHSLLKAGPPVEDSPQKDIVMKSSSLRKRTLSQLNRAPDILHTTMDVNSMTDLLIKVGFVIVIKHVTMDVNSMTDLLIKVGFVIIIKDHRTF